MKYERYRLVFVIKHVDLEWRGEQSEMKLFTYNRSMLYDIYMYIYCALVFSFIHCVFIIYRD